MSLLKVLQDFDKILLEAFEEHKILSGVHLQGIAIHTSEDKNFKPHYSGNIEFFDTLTCIKIKTLLDAFIKAKDKPFVILNVLKIDCLTANRMSLQRFEILFKSK